MEAVKVIGYLDCDQLMEYANIAMALLIILVIVVCLICGIVLGHCIVHRIRG